MNVIKVGDAEIRSALEMALTERPITWLSAERTLIEANRDWLTPHFLEAGDTWTIEFRTWVLTVNDKVIIVDPCTGNGRPHPAPYFNMLDTPFIERLREAGVRPEEVDYVFCTHMHHDHCGWNTRLRGGRWIPTFPNARYIFVRREYERWDPNGSAYQAVDFNEGVYERSILPIVEAGLADLVADHHQILPGLKVEQAPGHTHGHATLHLSSEMEEACFSGDCFHHPLQLVNPKVQFGPCDDLQQAISAREKLAAWSLERSGLIIPAHLPAPHAGRMRRVDGKLIFEGARGSPSG